MRDVIGVYRSTDLSTASPAQVVIALYDAAARFVRTAATAYDAGDVAGGTVAVTKAERIVVELMAHLDLDRGGQLAGSLLRLYQHMIEQLSAGRRQAATPPLREVLELLDTLRGAWVEADQVLRMNRAR